MVWDQRGASLVEFLVCVPVLLFIGFFLFSINEMLSDRQFLQVGMRNIVAASKSNQVSAMEVLEDEFEAGIRLPQSDAANAQLNKIDPRKIQYGAYTLTLEEETSELNVQDKEKIEAIVKNDRSKNYRNISEISGAIARYGVELLDGLKNFELPIVNESILIADVPGRIRLKIEGSEGVSVFGRSQRLILDMFSGQKNRKSDFSVVGFGYRRNEAGFHPEKYRLEGLLGYVVGFKSDHRHWADPAKNDEAFKVAVKQSFLSSEVPEGFPKSCSMNFLSNSNCKYQPIPLFPVIVRSVGMIKGVVQFVLNYFSISTAEAANQLAKKGIDDVIAGIEDEIVKAIESAIEEQLTEGAKQQLENGFDRFSEKIEEQVQGKIEQLVGDQSEVLEN